MKTEPNPSPPRQVKVKVEPVDETDGDNQTEDAVHNGAASSSVIVKKEEESEPAPGKVSNVVRTLFTREIGYPFFPGGGGAANKCNGILETRITRQLVSSRAAEFTGEAKVKAIHVCGLSNVQNNQSKNNWTQLKVSHPENTQLAVVDGGLWKVQKEGRAADSRFVEEFYRVEPEARLGFVLTKRDSFRGKVKCSATGVNSIYLLTLHEPSYLRAFDTVNGKTASSLNLDLGITPGLKAYTDFDVCDSIAKLFIMGTGPSEGIVKVILILDFPPSWTKVGIIYVNRVEVSLSISDGLCLMKQNNKTLNLTTWPMLYSKVRPLKQPTGKIPDTSQSLKVVFEGELGEMPDLINSIKLYDDTYGVLFHGIPLVYGATEYGVKFYYSVGSADDAETEPEFVYEFQLTTRCQQDIDVIPFPDSTHRVLITSHINKTYEVVEFSTKRDEKNGKTLSYSKTVPFEHWNDLKKKEAANVAARIKKPAIRRRRPPRRSCSKRNTQTTPCEKTSILGIQYNGILDLIAVLMADEEHFLVILYDPHSFEVFKILPQIRAWPTLKSGQANAKRECIEGVHFAFESHFIFISFDYVGISKSNRDYFCLRLMTNEDPNELETLQ